jgi:hypothetical protein
MTAVIYVQSMETLLSASKHISTCYHQVEVHLDNVVHIPMQHYQLHQLFISTHTMTNENF